MKIINLFLLIRLIILVPFLNNIWISKILIKQSISNILDVSFLVMLKENLIRDYRTIMIFISQLIRFNMKIIKIINKLVIFMILVKINKNSEVKWKVKSELIIYKKNHSTRIIWRLKNNKILTVAIIKHLKSIIVILIITIWKNRWT